MSNPHISGIKKDLVPRVIINGYNLYLGFAHESAKKPLRYYDFLEGFGKCEEYEYNTYEGGDFIYKLGISSYFELNDKIMKRGLKYNLMKKKNMSIIKKNTEKYVPIVIQFESSTYVGFITEESYLDARIPRTYRKFMGTGRGGFPMKDKEKAVPDDFVYKMSLGLYFKLSCELREYCKKYNLNKIKHELNNR